MSEHDVPHAWDMPPVALYRPSPIETGYDMTKENSHRKACEFYTVGQGLDAEADG